MDNSGLKIPYYYTPRPQQRLTWERNLSGRYDYCFKCWHRQGGKDTDDIQFSIFDSWTHPGTQTAYIGLDNKWIKRNIWDKYLNGRRHWDSYPKNQILLRETAQQILMLNNPDHLAEALIQFIGFKESESLVGSSYDKFRISELSLYKRGAFDFITPIWENKQAEGAEFMVNFNFTPRGMNNLAADLLRTYTGEEDPSLWPGEHGRVYVDFLPANKSLKHDGTRLYTDEHLEEMRQKDIRQHGNDNLFRQEFMLEFLAVNAGLVYPAIEILKKENRYHPFNINRTYPVYMAWDISSKGKESDWTSAIVFQYYNEQLFIYDFFEDNRKAVVECVQDLAAREYFHLIRGSAMPWDADRSGSKSSPFIECREQFRNINWHILKRSYENDGINRVRKLFPNMHINSNNCEWLVECLESWEYKELISNDDWAGQPKHDRYSHLMAALRYTADFIDQVESIRIAPGQERIMPSHYRGWQEEEEEDFDNWDNMPVGMRPSKFSPLRKKKPSQLYPEEHIKKSDGGIWYHEKI